HANRSSQDALEGVFDDAAEMMGHVLEDETVGDADDHFPGGRIDNLKSREPGVQGGLGYPGTQGGKALGPQGAFFGFDQGSFPHHSNLPIYSPRPGSATKNQGS